MEIVDQHVKSIMEGCKERARDAGLKFEDESLEYIVTNRDLLELSPKVMIPTLYDYWVHDVKVLTEKGKYELYPGNPYETVINTRPPISFYNDNNPDWLNVMIFYHVLAHIDFFQNNLFFRHTWDFDFEAQALSDKRLIARYRSEKGRWLDYVIEFARGIDNLTGYHKTVSDSLKQGQVKRLSRLDYYFDIFLQKEKKVTVNDYVKEIERYNRLKQEESNYLESFFADIHIRYPEFEALYKKKRKEKLQVVSDVMQFIINHSDFLAKEENTWMKTVMEVIRNTSLFFQPQIRTKIMNEGWASIWHEMLFMQDSRIKGHEADFAKVNAGVTSMPKVGLNPYALGMRLFYHIKEMEDKGAYSWEYFRIQDEVDRKKFDAGKGTGMDIIFKIRENYCDFTFINSFIDQEFVNRHDLFVTGTRVNQARMTMEYYVKSRNAEDYKEMLVNTLYHPPDIHVDEDKTAQGPLYLVHRFEGKPLKVDFIENTMIGIEFLWGGSVRLETWEPAAQSSARGPSGYFADPSAVQKKPDVGKKIERSWKKVLYVMENRKLHKREI